MKKLQLYNLILKQSKFITIDGVEGAGKSTQIEFIANYLQDKNIDFILTREPGGSKLGDDIRSILLNKKTGNISAKSELLLVFAARVEHIQTKILPALKQGKWVVSDRFTDSSYAYQGGGRGVDFAKIKQLEDWAMANFRPDLSLFLDINLQLSAQRIDLRGNKDRFEQEKNDFFVKVYKAFKQRAKDNPQRIKVIDASLKITQVSMQIKLELDKL